MAEDGAERILSVHKTFRTHGTYVDVKAFRVPPSERYPEGVKYSMQYGEIVGETVFRYDNFPDHPDAPRHHKHTADGRVIGWSSRE